MSHTSPAQRAMSEVLVWITVLFGLLVGFLYMRSTTDRTTLLTQSGASLSVPLTWSSERVEGTLVSAHDWRAGSFGPRVSVTALTHALMPEETLSASVARYSLNRGEPLEGYRVLGIKPAGLRVNGTRQDAVNLTFAYLQDAPAGSDVPPAVMIRTDTVTRWKGALYAVSFAAERDEYPRLDSLRARLTADVRLP
ncbi:hypothetical protein [Deinococcus peraridilitoris]|nr:hypothetical protein [Deinococcus peraridilitoris]